MKIFFLFFCFCLFIGCSNSPKGSTGDEVRTPASSLDLRSIFPYEFKFDTIAYMSCSHRATDSSSNRGAFFAFKVGAYKPGAGLKLSSDFLEATSEQSFFSKKNSFQSAYAADANGKAGFSLQLALRGSRPADLGVLRSVGSGAQPKTDDYNIFLYSPYGAERILTQLLNLSSEPDDPYLRYQAGVTDRLITSTGFNSYRYFEQILEGDDASVASNGTRSSAAETIVKLNNNEFRLSALYTYQSRYNLEASSHLLAEHRGRSFQLGFDSNDRELSRVGEYIVKTSNVAEDNSATWQCDSYQVVRDEHRHLCKTAKTAANDPGLSSNLPLKEAMENIWGSTGFWKFNHTQKCAVYQLDESIKTRPMRLGNNVCYDEVALLALENDHFSTIPPDPMVMGYKIAYKVVNKVGSTDKIFPGTPPQSDKTTFVEGDTCDSSDPKLPSCPHLLSACWRSETE